VGAIAILRYMTDAEFDVLITRAMDELPQEYIKGLDNVAIVMADSPTPEQQHNIKLGNRQLLLGLYEGTPLTRRGANYSFVLPDKITLFKNPILASVHDETELSEQIKRTLWHEIAHYYGLGHGRINQLQRGDK
jgi:predicted Zn-dependent protease with MMP-like domain